MSHFSTISGIFKSEGLRTSPLVGLTLKPVAIPDDFIPRFSDEYHPDEDTQGQQEASAGLPAISRSPVKSGGGANFGTHHLKEVSHNKMAFRPTMRVQMLSWVFFALGIGALNFGFKQLFTSISSMDDDTWGLIIFGLFFGSIGFFLTFSLNLPIVFDKSRSLFRRGFWRGKAPDPSTSTPEPYDENWVRLDRIVGIQLLTNGSSCELNLVLDDQQRINVVAHGNAEQSRADAEKLSYFLGVPIYDQR